MNKRNYKQRCYAREVFFNHRSLSRVAAVAGSQNNPNLQNRDLPETWMNFLCCAAASYIAFVTYLLFSCSKSYSFSNCRKWTSLLFFIPRLSTTWWPISFSSSSYHPFVLFTPSTINTCSRGHWHNLISQDFLPLILRPLNKIIT